MPDGTDMINLMEFKERLKDMQDRELIEFAALQVYEACIIVKNNTKRITGLEKRDRKDFGIVGSLGAFFGAAVAIIAEFIRRG